MKEIYGNKIKASIPTLIDNNITYSTDLDKANLFADLFSSQCSLDPPPPGYSLPDIEYLTDQRLSTVTFEVDQVYRLLKSLNIGKATGPDGIGNRLLKECADTLAVPLTDIYNKSMNDMIFPEDWKLSHSPVYKKAFRHIKENYRPVSLLAYMSKPMERIVYNVMYSFFKSLGLLSTRNSGFKERDSTINQLIHLCHYIYLHGQVLNRVTTHKHLGMTFERIVYNVMYSFFKSLGLLSTRNSGFKERDSTISQLIHLCHYIYQGLDNCKDVCLVFLDVSKAFDKVYHPALLHKLQCMGIATFNATKTVYMVISNRKNQIYPNLYLHGQVLTKVKVYKHLGMTFSEWAEQWRVTFNAAKTVLNRVTTHKHLGMTFSDDMKWGAHIDAILKKAFNRLNGIRRLKQVITRTVKETLYKSLVLPLVEYGSVLFDNCSAALKLRLERLYRNAAVIVTGAFRNTSFARLLNELGWDTLDDRRKLARLSLYKKITISAKAHKDGPTDQILVPEYLYSMVPQSVGDRAGYVLRNAAKG